MRRFLDPKTLREAIAPLAFANWVIGISVFEYPPGNRRPILSAFYSAFCIAIYEYTIYVSIEPFLSSFSEHDTQLSITFHQGLLYGNMVLVVSATVLGWIRREGVKGSIARVNVVDESMERIGIPKNYRTLFRSQLIQLVGIALFLSLLVAIDIIWLYSKITVKTNMLSYCIALHHPLLVMLIADFTFVNTVGYIGKRFRALNKFLERLVTCSLNHKGTDISPRSRTIIVAYSPKAKRNLVQTSRQIHLELCRTAQLVNTTYGVQILLSMAVSFTLITGLLYNTYTELMRVAPEFYTQTIQELIPLWCWCILYAGKILMINHACATTSYEAKKTGEIIHELQDPIINEELEKEVRKFSLQMIQNPLTFTACGFFTLDYTFVQGVIGSITSYLVIMIQMSTIPGPLVIPNNRTTS